MSEKALPPASAPLPDPPELLAWPPPEEDLRDLALVPLESDAKPQGPAREAPRQASAKVVPLVRVSRTHEDARPVGAAERIRTAQPIEAALAVVEPTPRPEIPVPPAPRAEPRLTRVAAPPRARRISAVRVRLDRGFVATLVGVATLVLFALIAYGMMRWLRTPEAQPATGTLVVDSQPAGASVAIEGVPRGRTPLRLALAPGTYRLELRHGAAVRYRNVRMEPSSSVSEYLELLPASPVARPQRGRLRITSDPLGAQVTLDGAPRGVTPLDLELAEGRYKVTVKTASRRETRGARVQAGRESSLAFRLTAPPPAPKPAVGWVAVQSPVPVNVFANGELVGSSDSDRLPLAPGTHTLRLVNEALGFEGTQDVTVTGGRKSAVSVDLPEGALHVNAVPWAEVLVDGQRMGETPMGRLALRIGTHEVLLRNPELGERRTKVTIRAGAPTRLSVDFTK